jgi:hypothetical protein
MYHSKEIHRLKDIENTNILQDQVMMTIQSPKERLEEFMGLEKMKAILAKNEIVVEPS